MLPFGDLEDNQGGVDIDQITAANLNFDLATLYGLLNGVSLGFQDQNDVRLTN